MSDGSICLDTIGMQSSWNLSAFLAELLKLFLPSVINDIYVDYLAKVLHSRYGSKSLLSALFCRTCREGRRMVSMFHDCLGSADEATLQPLLQDVGQVQAPAPVITYETRLHVQEYRGYPD